MDIKIIVATHKCYWMPDDPVYLPLQVGAEGKTDLGYIADNTGDNISSKNASFCELTGLFWAWKHVTADYIGMVHYRRYFTHSNPYLIAKKRQGIFTKQEYELLLQKTDIIVPNKRHYYIETTRSQYEHAHHPADLRMTEQIIQKKYPEYVAAFQKVMNRTWGHRFNMFVMKKDCFCLYCTWLFDILFTLEQRLDISHYDLYNQRVFGFIAERLLDVWLETVQKSYIEQNVCYMERQNWLLKGGTFLKRKLFAERLGMHER